MNETQAWFALWVLCGIAVQTISDPKPDDGWFSLIGRMGLLLFMFGASIYCCSRWMSLVLPTVLPSLTQYLQR